MTLESLFAFTIAAAVILAIPGPTVALVLGHSLVYGKRATWPLVLGVVLGDLMAMIVSLMGLGAIMAASASLFTLFKWSGAVYLVYMGVSMWRSNLELPNSATKIARKKFTHLFRSAFLVTVFNPKSIIFFVAFFPQFITPSYDLSIQLVTLGSIFLVLTVVSVVVYAGFAVRMRALLNTAASQRWLRRGSGAALVGIGVLTASAQRTA